MKVFIENYLGTYRYLVKCTITDIMVNRVYRNNPGRYFKIQKHIP